MNKYRNKITVVDGIRFSSKREAKRYSELLLLFRAGEIIEFTRQVPYPVASAGKKTKRYIADFVVLWKNGKQTVEDVKGVKTQLYELKKLLMLEKYGIEITEI